MNEIELKNLAEKNEVRIDNHKNFKSTPPFYYDSLRHAFQFYFNTFRTHNASYESYAQGLFKRKVKILKWQYLDADNTVQSLIAFERFFELFIKDILSKVNPKLCLVGGDQRSKKQPINVIEANTFVAQNFNRKNHSVPFREALNRFYNLLRLSKTPSEFKIVKKFRKVFAHYSFLDSKDYEASLRVLNWYRDRILHRGNKLPTPWLFDYFVTQRLCPIVNDVVKAEGQRLGEAMFYFKTVTQIDLLELLTHETTRYDFKDLRTKSKTDSVFSLLLYIGHLKELGRANFNMNRLMRKNYATYEYNYHDPKGRGARFAIAESQHPNFKEIKGCPCCGEPSLVVYQILGKDLPIAGEDNITWVKCYTCDYHIRYNVGEPMYFNLNSGTFFG